MFTTVPNLLDRFLFLLILIEFDKLGLRTFRSAEAVQLMPTVQNASTYTGMFCQPIGFHLPEPFGPVGYAGLVLRDVVLVWRWQSGKSTAPAHALFL